MDYRIALDKNNYFLDSTGTKIKSNIIYIPVGHVALLSLYNMMSVTKKVDDNGKTKYVNKSCFTIRKLSLGPTADIDMVRKCGDRINIHDELMKLLANRRVFSEEVIQNCCPWVIDPGNNFVLIPTPGFYELETEDIDQIDTMYVEYVVFSAEYAAAIPDGFKLGAKHGVWN